MIRPVPCVADPRRDDLHVTREYDEIDAVLAREARRSLQRRRLVLRLDGHMLESQSLALDHVAEVLVVGNDERNFQGSSPARQRQSRSARQWPSLLTRIAVRSRAFSSRIAPVGLELVRQRGERLPQAGVSSASVPVSMAMRVKNQPLIGSVN